ncbi:MAG: hypothetical protein HC855_16195 [Rhizobiales bacterium]|nr:hypothetical protein [Hyphomicrobiales bacterium]
MTGGIAWLAWLLVHLTYLSAFQNRLLVFIQWAGNYLTRYRWARLITAEQRDISTASAPIHTTPST